MNNYVYVKHDRIKIESIFALRIFSKSDTNHTFHIYNRFKQVPFIYYFKTIEEAINERDMVEDKMTVYENRKEDKNEKFRSR